MNPPLSHPFPRRRPGVLLWWVGKTLAAGGAIALVVGAALPWVIFPVFGVTISLPGASLWGALTGLVGLTTLYGLRSARAAPFHALLGFAALLLAGAAHAQVGRAVVRQMLHVKMNLASVNERLASVALPPIEPFDSVRPGRDYLGPGILWTLWGGSGVLIGSLFVVAGARLRRTCSSCGALWPSERVGEIAFCFACGSAQSAPRPLCPSCRREVAKGDRHCVTCGTALPAPPHP